VNFGWSNTESRFGLGGNDLFASGNRKDNMEDMFGLDNMEDTFGLDNIDDNTF
jgi:hypothetical protein